MKTAFILFPNTLFADVAPLLGCDVVYLVEEYLFFKQYPFHKQKIIFHRASMKAYEKYLTDKGVPICYLSSFESFSDSRLMVSYLKTQGIGKISVYHPCDDWLQQRLTKACSQNSVELHMIENPLFLNTTAFVTDYRSHRNKYLQTDFYIQQRKLRKILVDDSDLPLNGKWSFDADNRHKYPRGKKTPPMQRVTLTAWHTEAETYVETYFSSNHGKADRSCYYPIDHAQAEAALGDFFTNRFDEFGAYEDAILKDEMYLHHSVLSPLLNTGLLLPGDVIQKAIAYADQHHVPFNSLEGFVRQLLGWREFIRMVYLREGRMQRTRNYWGFKRKIPHCFYTATTGIGPIDNTIRKLKRSGYSHHIERLMLLSNFMLLCEFDPDDVYKWFMEMYIDAYDWVMVPNVYGMAQFADGGLMCTKPYISGSNYVFKMSDYNKDNNWSDIWDALFWRFMHVHRSFFLQNPRLGMLVNTFDKWHDSRKHTMLQLANDFLAKLDAWPDPTNPSS